MRRSLIVLVGALAALPLAAGCSTAVSGTPAPATDTPSLIPGHVYTVQPSAPASTSAQPHPTGVTAACPLLPASAVGKAFGVSGLKAVAKQTAHPHEYGCSYRSGDGVFASLGVLTRPSAMMTLEKSKRAIEKAKTRCTDPKPIPGLGPLSATCRLKEHPKITAGFTLQPSGSQTVLLSFDAPHGPQSAEATADLIRVAVSHLPTH